MLQLFFLGPPQIEQGGRRIEPDTRKATALLAYLSHNYDYYRRDTLAALLWPEFDERHAKGALRRTLSTLKTTIGGKYFYIANNMIGLIANEVWCDVTEFRRLLTGSPDIRALEKAVELYQDHFLAGFSLRDSLPFDHWQTTEGESLRRELSMALDKVTNYYLTEHHFEAAIRFALRWLEIDLLREETHRLLMQLFAWSGQRSAALNQYRSCVRILEAELGVLPLAETTALYHEIQSERFLALPARFVDSSVALASPPAGTQSSATSSLIGRQLELEQMTQFYAQIGPAGRFLVITGEAGIGKTSLCEAFIANHSRAFILSTRCYKGESHLAYAPIIQAVRDGLKQADLIDRLGRVAAPWLIEISRLLPELLSHFPDLSPPPFLDWPGDSTRFLEGICQVLEALLVGHEPGILWIDDGQWADNASLDWLTFFVRRLQTRSLLVLVCWREDEIASDHRLRLLLSESRRTETGRSIALPRLTLAQVQEMAAGSPISPERLFHETEGVPILVREYLAFWPTTWELPPTTRDLFQSRLAQADDAGQQLLQTAAVIGRPFDFELLQQTSGRSEEELLAGLERLIRQGILVEQGDGLTYRFSHHKLGELVYEETTLLRHRLLHKRVAQALAGRPIRDGVTGEIARHYQQAGQEKEAAIYYRQAGDEARTLFAHQEALHNYQTALALGHPEPALLHELCGDLLTRRGEYRAALSSYERAAALNPLARLEHKIGQIYYRQGEWGSAEGCFERAEAAWSGDDLARLYIDWSYMAYRRGDFDKARERSGRVLPHSNSSPIRAQLHNISGILARHEGKLEAAREHFQQSYQLARQYTLLDMQITALNNLALVETILGRPAAAQKLFQTALEHCQLYGDRHWQAALHNNLADLFHHDGNQAAAMAELKQAVAIYADIGQEAGNWQPEIWKLSEW